MPNDDAERAEWIVKRGKMLDRIIGTEWIGDEIARLYQDPHAYAEGELFDKSLADDNELYVLFKLAFNAGVEYERQYPTGQRRDWDTPDLDVPTDGGEGDE